DVHAIWIDPSNSRHVIIGDDGGLAQTFDQAKTWLFFPNLPVGLFYHVSYDMSVPYNVCGGMQDNYDWCGPSQVRSAPGIANYQWTTLQGGDGFVVLQDPKENRVIYSETQDGNMVRVDRTTDETESIRPVPAPGEPPYRWNWDTPFVMSPADPAVVYTAAQKVLRSPDRGLTWTGISPDLTSNENRDDIVTMGLKGSDITISKDDGISAWPTIVSLAESPKHPGLIYAGTDDGNLQVTKDGGKNWVKVYDKLPNAPKGAWVSRIAPSRFDEGTVYVTIDDHRQDDYGTYVYVSADYGQTWTSLAGNLASFGEVVLKCVTEDQKNPDVLYLGAETGLFISVDRGQTWYYPHTNLPDVRIDEITLHPRDNAMLLATHGRAIWILDHLEPIQEYAAAQKAEAKLFTPAPTSMYRRPANDRNYEFWGDQTFFGENPPQEAVISYYLRNKATDVTLKITDAAGHDVREISGAVLASAAKPGINAACWDLRVDPNPAPQGAAGRGGRSGRGGSESNAPAQNPYGAGCPETGARGGGFGGGGAAPGPWVLAGTYNVALIVDGKTVDTKPLRVADDPEVGLTAMQRKQMFDMAMEMHELQRRTTEASEAVGSLNRQMGELSQTIESRGDIPADVKTSFDALKKQVADVMPQLAAPAGRGFGGGGRGGGTPTVAGKIAQAKNGMMGGLWPTAQTLKTYNDAKLDAPKTLAAANTAIAQAHTVSASLAQYNLTLTAPAPIAAPAAKPAKKKT
ncbi:MAG TPA: hypothetical protein VGL62_06515, partial [Vicinamibacterales bacterium]